MVTEKKLIQTWADIWTIVRNLSERCAYHANSGQLENGEDIGHQNEPFWHQWIAIVHEVGED